MVEKRITSEEDLKKWKESKTFNFFVSFINQLAESVKGRENTDYVEPISNSIRSVCGILDSIVESINKHPILVDANTSRFGKIEFRDVYDEIKTKSKQLVLSLDKSIDDFHVKELAAYLTESWGNRERIDYGSGHELNFMCFLYGLLKHRYFDMERDSANILLCVFIKYLEVMRILETKYWLEPAGSHGVWGLDDYHFLPFLFGAFQLSTHKNLVPKSIRNEEVVELFESRYLYFGCVAFINKVKTSASLRWHSPMLDDISSVKTWSKVSEGMVKMYKSEVLCKLPVMQHFYFSSFLPAPEGVSSPRNLDVANENECLTTHSHAIWGDCCGIPIPSAIAAKELNKTSRNPLPFD